MDMAKQIIFEDEQIRVIFYRVHRTNLFSLLDLITRAKGNVDQCRKVAGEVWL